MKEELVQQEKSRKVIPREEGEVHGLILDQDYFVSSEQATKGVLLCPSKQQRLQRGSCRPEVRSA